jgi:hypothetical protein
MSFLYLVQSIRTLKFDKSSINSAECSLCKYIVSYVDAVIQNNKSEAAIEAALEKVCTILPGALKDKCVTFVETYGPILAQLIAKYGTPQLVCDALKACHNGTQENVPRKFSMATATCDEIQSAVAYFE